MCSMPIDPHYLIGWQQLRNITLTPIEIDLLLSLDAVYRSEEGKAKK